LILKGFSARWQTGACEVRPGSRDFEVLIDREEIYAFEDWWKRVLAATG
jgi:hypothetical protein